MKYAAFDAVLSALNNAAADLVLYPRANEESDRISAAYRLVSQARDILEGRD